jgi:hypothetical protein
MNNNNNNNNNNNKTEQTKKISDTVTKFGNQKEEKFYTSVYIFGKKVTLWIPKALWEKFKELAKLENLSASKLTEKLVLGYINAHSRGNPQLLLTHYIEPGKEPQPIRVLCIYCDGALSEGKVYCQKRGMWIPSVSCYSCKENRLRKNR